MRRDPRLRALSSDHHHALVLARRAATADPARAPELWAAIRRDYDEALAPHFEIEERLLLPALAAAGETALVERTRAEHEAMRALLDGDDDLPRRLRELGALLTAHVRFEERELFPTAEVRLPAAILDAIARAEPGSDPSGSPS